MGRIASFLGLNRSMTGILSMAILVGMGERMAERFLPIYIMALGGGAWAVGLLNGLDNLLSALYSFPGGYLSDRFGTKRALLLFNLMAMSGFLIVIAIPSWVAVIFGAILFLSWTAISLPATMAVVARVLPVAQRTMGVSMHSLVRRIPMALGPVLGGIFIATWGEINGVRFAFVAALVLAAVAAVLQFLLIEKDDVTVPANFDRNPLRHFHQMSPGLKQLLLSDILVRFCEQIPYAFVVVWAMKQVANPVNAVEFGILTTIEMVTAILIYIPVAHAVGRSSKKPFVVVTFAIFSAFPLVLAVSESFWILAVAFVVRGLKELGEPARKTLIMDLAPEDRKAATFGLYYLLRDSVVSLAAFGGAFLWLIDPLVNFGVAFLCGAAGTVWFWRYGTDVESERVAMNRTEAG